MNTARLSLWPALIIAVAIVPARQVGACSCVPDRAPFFEAAARSPLVVRGVVKRHHGHWGIFAGTKKYLDLEVSEVLKGTFGSRLLLIVGDNGAQCRHYVTEFSVGSEWVFVLASAPESSQRRPAFEISRCSESALGVVDEQVGGLLTRNPGGHLQSLSLPGLRSLIKGPLARGGV